MDIFYKNQVNDGMLSVFRLPASARSAVIKFNGGTKLIKGTIIQSITYGQQSLAQFQQSLDNVIYVYSFGEQMGQLTVNGLAFPRQCNTQINGIDELMNFYKQNRISNNLADIKISIGTGTIVGYLVGMSLNTFDPASGVQSFSLSIRTVPSLVTGK